MADDGGWWVIHEVMDGNAIGSSWGMMGNNYIMSSYKDDVCDLWQSV